MIRVIRSFRRNNTFWQEAAPLAFADHYSGSKLFAVDSSKTYQTHLGFGGAFTEAAAVTFWEAPEEIRKEIIEAYFSERGLKYNLGRVPIHSTDFSVKSRTYLQENDETLASFSLAGDDEAIVPFIREAIARVPDLWLLASPWSPPAFMKTNRDLYYGGRLKKEYYHHWAKYFVRYIQEMAKRGIKIAAVTVQNEPAATQVWESCLYSAEEEKEFLKILHEEFQKAWLDVKILIWDHNRDLVPERAHAVLREVPELVWGVAYHWYVCEDAENLSLVHDLHPDHHIIFTEGCVEYSVFGKDDRWRNGEFYGRNIIKDSLNHSEGFIEWNLLLNEEGGPNHVGNYCEAPIFFDRREKRLRYNPSYYYIGHFSRFIEPGAKRIHLNKSADPEVFASAYRNPDGKIVIIVQNEGYIKEYTIIVDGNSFVASLPERSISTYIIG